MNATIPRAHLFAVAPDACSCAGTGWRLVRAVCGGAVRRLRCPCQDADPDPPPMALPLQRDTA